MLVLIGVAVVGAAVAGCVSVTPASGPAPAHAPAEVEPTRATDPLVVEAPAREALESAGPAPAKPSRVKPSRAAARPRAAQRGTGSRHRATAPAPQPRSTRAPVRRKRPPAKPPVRLPANAGVPVTVPDVCGMVERSGGWRPGSRESRACREAARR
ncbi:hypothetical protein ACFPM3_25265 [Streptomyces coeruleoprunus]|uniref:Lipoprotein n=1 Tax=Streptomyces coeruleoprunus TaxID=285563 RepID=A0ABV9XJ72_9ACTN